MSNDGAKKPKNDSLTGVLIGVIAPVLVLDYCSKDGDRLWQLGPAWAMALALCLPIAYGIFRYAVTRKTDLMSLIGLIGVLCTGLITLWVVKADGSIAQHTPWLFAAKEALIPLILAAAVVFSARTESPLIRAFLYTPDLFNIDAIEKSIRENGEEDAYKQCINRATWTLGGSLLASSAANFCLALFFLLPVLQEPLASQQEAYNYAVGRQTWWGFLVIGVPLMIALMGMMWYLVRRLGKLTGLPTNRLLMR